MMRLAQPARAFTLLEVMLATIIIGLGVLGLTALFAGAAKQQIDTARLSDAVKLTQSVEGTLRQRIGEIATGWDGAGNPHNNSPYNTGQYQLTGGNGVDVPLAETCWYPLSAYPPKVNDPTWPGHALAIDPRPNLDLTAPLGGPQGLFFVVQGEQNITLYENPLDVNAPSVSVPLVGRPIYGGALMNPTIARLVEYIYNPTTGVISGQNFAPFDPASPGVPGLAIARLPHGRIHPGSMRIRFDVATQKWDPNSGSLRAEVVARRSIVFDDAPYYAESDADNFAGPTVLVTGPHPLQNANMLEGLVTEDQMAYLRVNRTLTPPSGNPPPETSAFIESFILPLAGNEWVERIVLERHAYRADSLLTLDERVRANGDGRTYMGAAILLQRARGGGQRPAILAYSAEPIGGPFPEANPPEFIPPESGALANRLLRDLDLRLVYDNATGLTYVTPRTNTTPPTFALEVGDIFLISGDPQTPQDPTSAQWRPGADDFCRVLRNEARSGGGADYRSYLLVAPRAAGRPLVGPAIGPISPPQDLDVRAWALRPIVESLQDYRPRPNAAVTRVKWKITPLEGRVAPGAPGGAS